MMILENKTERLERIGKFIQLGRKQANLTQRQLASKLEVSHTYISKLENNNLHQYPSIDLLQRCAVIFDMNVEQAMARLGMIDTSALKLSAVLDYETALLLNYIAIGSVGKDAIRDLLDIYIYRNIQE